MAPTLGTEHVNPTFFDRMKQETPLKLAAACAQLGVGRSYVCAIKKKLGIRGRFVFLSVIIKFMKDNPGFREGTFTEAPRPAPCAMEFSSGRPLWKSECLKESLGVAVRTVRSACSREKCMSERKFIPAFRLLKFEPASKQSSRSSERNR
jgi:hypothetical protein